MVNALPIDGDNSMPSGLHNNEIDINKGTQNESVIIENNRSNEDNPVKKSSVEALKTKLPSKFNSKLEFKQYLDALKESYRYHKIMNQMKK